MKITEISISRTPTVFALMVIVVFMGTASYIALPRESAPQIEIPFVMVYAPYFGSSPADMEKLVTRKLETQLHGLSDLKEMTSTSAEGVSSIVLEFEVGIDMSDALQKVRDAVELAKPELPADTREDLIVQEFDSNELWPVMDVVLSGDYDPVRLKKAAEDLQEAIEQIRGVLGVGLTGGVEREVRVDVDPERLRFYSLGLTDVMDAIREENVTIPGGELSLGTYDYQVRVPGEFSDVETIQDIVVNPAVLPPVYLRDVAEVSFGIKERESISRLNASDSVTLSVKKQTGENIIKIADEVRKTIEEMRSSLPEGTRIAVVSDQSIQIKDMVAELENNILSGLILVVVCLFLFLGIRNAFFAGAAIPFSMLISVVVLRFLDITLNMVVLFSLILALGMLVDNAIVVIENIFRNRTAGMPLKEAALKGTAQVATPVVASTLTTLCAFGPLVFWPGVMGEFMKYLPITVIITLAASLLVALVFNPVLCATFMKIPKATSGKPRLGDRLLQVGLRTYDPVIRWALRHRWKTLAGMVVIFIATLVVFGNFNAGIELFPDVDPTYAFASLEAPSGTRLELSDTYARDLETAIRDVPDLTAFVTKVGAGGQNDFGGSSGGGSPHLSRVSMEFVKKEERSQSSRTSLSTLRKALESFTGARLVIDKFEEGPPTGKPVNIEVTGDDFARLGDISNEIQDRIRDIPGLVNLQDDYDQGRPEIQIVPDLDKAARMGLRTLDVASTIRTALHGEDVTKYRVGEDEYDIVVRFAQPARKSVEDIEELTVFYEGENIPLGAFADVRYTTGLGAIHRIDTKRVVTVTGDVAAGYNGVAILGQVQQRLDAYRLPIGYRLEFTGESEDQEEAMSFLFSPTGAFMTAIMLIFVVLITQFNSVTHPFVIMSSVILSFIGVFLGLLLTRTAFGIIMTGVGVISLAGVVVNNAIVLVHYINLLRQEGREKLEAIVEAGRTRFRPVILTAVTTILGLVPLTTGFSIDFGRLFTGDFGRAVVIGGESSQWWGPMGVAVIWGLAVATFLTLVVVPVMYSTIDPVIRAIRWVFIDVWSQLLSRPRPGKAASE